MVLEAVKEEFCYNSAWDFWKSLSSYEKDKAIAHFELNPKLIDDDILEALDNKSLSDSDLIEFVLNERSERYFMQYMGDDNGNNDYFMVWQLETPPKDRDDCFQGVVGERWSLDDIKGELQKYFDIENDINDEVLWAIAEILGEHFIAAHVEQAWDDFQTLFGCYENDIREVLGLKPEDTEDTTKVTTTESEK